MVRTGVEVSTALSAGRRNTGVASARYHVAGITERGPVGVAYRISSPAEYEAVFGGRTAKSEDLYNDARLFFAERGAEMYVTRVVGAAATRGFVTLSDASAAPTIRIELNEPGSYSEKTSVRVEEGAHNTFNLSIYQEGLLVLRLAGLESPQDLLTRTLRHPLITVSNLASASAPPGNNPAPTAEPVFMSAGTDDFTSVTAEDHVAALDATGEVTRGGACAVPGIPADVIGPGLIAHGAAYQKVVILCGEVGTTEEEIKEMAGDLTNPEDASHAGVFWPFVILPDDTNTGSRFVAPCGYVAAARARAHTTVGYWQIPAGDRSTAVAITGLASPVDTRRNNSLAEAYVSGIISDGDSIKLYNWWSLSPDRQNFQYLSVRDELNNIAMDVAAELRPFIFSTWDSRGKLLNQIFSAVKGVLATLAERDAVSARINPADGSVLDPGYTIAVDAPSGAFVEDNTIIVRVEVRTPQTAQLIKSEIVRVPLDAAL